MVLINVKLSEEDQFFYTTTCTTQNEELKRELVIINNWRKRLQLIILEGNELVKKGPMKEGGLVEDDLANRILYSLNERRKREKIRNE